jgi:hypothetical protein
MKINIRNSEGQVKIPPNFDGFGDQIASRTLEPHRFPSEYAMENQNTYNKNGVTQSSKKLKKKCNF